MSTCRHASDLWSTASNQRLTWCPREWMQIIMWRSLLWSRHDVQGVVRSSCGGTWRVLRSSGEHGLASWSQLVSLICSICSDSGAFVSKRNAQVLFLLLVWWQLVAAVRGRGERKESQFESEIWFRVTSAINKQNNQTPPVGLGNIVSKFSRGYDHTAQKRYNLCMYLHK